MYVNTMNRPNRRAVRAANRPRTSRLMLAATVAAWLLFAGVSWIMLARGGQDVEARWTVFALGMGLTALSYRIHDQILR